MKTASLFSHSTLGHSKGVCKVGKFKFLHIEKSDVRLIPEKDE